MERPEPVDDPLDADADDMLERAIEMVVQQGTASVSLLQRRLGVGYARAGRLVDAMERMGVVSGPRGLQAPHGAGGRGRPRPHPARARPPDDGGRRRTEARLRARRRSGLGCRTGRGADLRPHAPTCSKSETHSVRPGCVAASTCSDCEAETKIRAKYLRAMEEEQFDLMPSPTYVRGFLRAYAEFLDLDGQLVLDEYESRFGAYDPSEDRGAPARRGRVPAAPAVAIAPARPRRRPAAIRPRAPAAHRAAAPVARHRRRDGAWRSSSGWGWGRRHPDAGRPEHGTAPRRPPEPAPLVGEPDTSAVEAPVRTKPISIVLTGIGRQRLLGAGARARTRNGPLVYEGTIAPGQAQAFKVRDGIWVARRQPGRARGDRRRQGHAT